MTISTAQETAQLVSGEVVWASIVNGIENRHAIPKPRPVVIVDAPEIGCLTVIGLSQRPFTKGGFRRTVVPGCQRWGLGRQSFVYGSRTTRVARHDVFEHIDWITPEAAVVLSEMFNVRFSETAMGCEEAER
jgi:hypothetical protein